MTHTPNHTMDSDLARLLVTPLTTAAEATAWVYAMHDIGWGTHPDDRGADIVDAATGERAFNDDEAALLDARMDEAHNLCGDVYLVALDAFEGGPNRAPVVHLAADTGNHGPACGDADPAALTTGNPDEVTCRACAA